MKKNQQQLTLFQKEYVFYKEATEAYEAKQGSGANQIQQCMKEFAENEKDLRE